MFDTDHSFRVDSADDLRARIKNGCRRVDGTQISPLNWLGSEDWVCSGPLTPQGPVPTCKKHDLAFDSLQKFAGSNPLGREGGTALGDELDEAWNQRNKSLSDSKFYADIRKHGCQQQTGADAHIMCSTTVPRQIAGTYWFVVADINDKGWPVTDEDLNDGGGDRFTLYSLNSNSATNGYVDCQGPVPRVTNLTVTQVVGERFDVSWKYAPGCVDIEIARIEICLSLFPGGATGQTFCARNLSTTATSAQIRGSPWQHIVWTAVPAKVRIYPRNVSYGPDEYLQEFDQFPVRR